MMKNQNNKIEKLDKELDNASSLIKLSNSFDNINKAMNIACNNIYKILFDYKFSKYLYQEYILLNKSRKEIAINLNTSESSLYYYILKYNLKKDQQAKTKLMLSTLKQTCNQKYGINHPGELPEGHQKRIYNIVNKSNGHWDKTYYKSLKRSDTTKQKMSKAQQLRRKMEKEGDNN